MRGLNLTERATPLRLLLAERSAGSNGLSQLFADNDDIEVVGSARKAIEALALAEQLQPDAVLLDIEMPGETLVFVLDLMKRNTPPPAVVILIPYASLVLRERALEAGADYVFPRTADPERLLKALGKVARERAKQSA